MKELTYEDWQKNPTPRMMWVWDDEEEAKEQRKVIYFSNPKLSFPIIALNSDETCIYSYAHCAEIEKQRRMTNKELARWLREKPTRECKWTFDGTICSVHTYNEKVENEEVHKDVVIREDDGEWLDPLVEESIMFEKEAEDFLKKSLKVDDDEFDFFKNEASCKEEVKRLTDFIAPREKRIAELEKENAELKSEFGMLKTSEYQHYLNVKDNYGGYIMRRTKILTKKNQVILYKKLTDYLKEVLSDEENYSTFEDLYQEAKRVKTYGNIRYLTPSLIAEWLKGLPIGTAYATYDICVMIMDFLGLDKNYVGKLGDDDSIYVESQTDIDSYYWETLGDIIYQQHLKSLYR